MKALTLLQPHGAREQQAASGELYSNYLGQSMENRCLVQTSVLPQALSGPGSQPSSCSSLQPSRLTSTTSYLLSTTASSLTSPCLTSPLLTSPLLSTENKFLKRDSLLFPRSLFLPSPPPLPTLFNSCLGSSTRVLPPTCSLPPPVLNVEERMEGEGEGRIRQPASEDALSYYEEMTVDSDQDSLMAEETESSTEMPVLDMVLDEEELDQIMPFGEHEFGEMERGKDELEEELKDKKYLLLNEVCCSLVNKSTAPGQKDWDAEESVWKRIQNLSKAISTDDPQFLLKVAVYTRQELNIRITANFLLALAAHLPTSKPHVRRYFCAAVQLPSDWLEVVRLYSTCFGHSLPTCLKKALGDKFKQFNEYQLAKYNTRKHRCKHNRSRPKGKKPSTQQLEKWANMLGSDATNLQKYLKMERAVVDKKQSEFSLKKLIKRLHIKEPAQHVLAILGKRYPGDPKAFSRSGLSGVWDRERAGQRMKLKQPDTWERKLSQEGNKASTWEKLIDSNSLPFMAMLRNLRNMITQGISERHHQKILGRLTFRKAVIQSRQFPFRFLSAYKVIMELNNMARASEKVFSSSKEILRGILKKMPKNKRFSHLDWETAGKKRLRVALGVPFVYRIYNMKKSQLKKASQRLYSQALLEQYRKALETAVQISCRYNVPPLPGRTMIFFAGNMGEDDTWSAAQDFCCPPDAEAEKEDEEEKLTPSMQEVAVLLSLMIAHSAEHPQLIQFNWWGCAEAKLKSDVLLDNVRHVMKQVEEAQNAYDKHETFSSFMSREMTQKNKVDNIIVLADHYLDNNMDMALDRYRKDVNNKALVVKIFFGKRTGDQSTDRNCVVLQGFSEQILRFVAERGSSRLLDHVEHIDKLHHILPPQGCAKEAELEAAITPLPATPKLRWRGVRVFVSSTFRDMHAERDVLVRSVFPELRRRAAPHCLYLQEVELRWGVTEEETGRVVELCLSEVCRSQLLLGILGERYGLLPPRPSLPDLPQYSWLDSAPSGLSITEMEIRQFQALHPDTAQNRMFCYFRSPHLSRSVPVAWRTDFAPESKEAECKMADLKRRIVDSEAKVTENYPCEWGGVVDGKPYVKGLEEFGKVVLEDLWGALLKQFVEKPDESDSRSDLSEQEVHQGALQRQFFGRAKLLSGAVGKVQEAQLKGGMVLLEGAPGEGKTVFMAALANALRTPTKSQKTPRGDVISYSTAATQSACTVENLLRCLVQWLRRGKEKEDWPLPSSYKDLLTEFHSQLSDTRKDQPLALLVDGAEHVQDGRGQLTSDWIPQHLPQGVSLVLSVTSTSALLRVLAKNKRAFLFPLGQLSLPDRKEIVQKELAVYGKKLSDSAFNNQLQTLLMKKGAVSPLYLHLACEDLRNFASFEKMKESLQALPPSLSELVQHSLSRLQSQYREVGLGWALAALTVSTTGLRERDLYAILNICNGLTSGGEKATWQDMLHLARKPIKRVPMATFSHMVRSLQSLIDPSHCHGPDDLLALTNPEVRLAFKKELLLPGEADWTRAHILLAAHLWVLADPQGTCTFLHCEASSILNLPFHLMRSGQWEALHCLLSSYNFLFANVRHGLLHHLLETYSLFGKRFESEGIRSWDTLDQSGLTDCVGFLQRHAPLLSSWPALFLQQALNEPNHTDAHVWAQGMMGKGGKGVHVMRWLNNEQHTQPETSKLVSAFPSEPTCVVVSPGGGVMAVGTGQGTLHLVHTETGQEVRSLVSSCDGISGCVFLREGLMGTTSFDGRIELWDVENGCRTALIDGHSNRITGSDVSADRKHLATVSLDLRLKVWSSPKGSLVTALSSPSPLNCVTFDPEGHLVAAGGWDGAVRLWNWLKGEVTTLSGHQRSVRSLAFSPSSSLLCSGCLSGEVRLWSVPASTCVGRYQAHSGSTEVLTFLLGGTVLLSAGSDHTVQLWSGGLGRSVNVFGEPKESVVQKGKKMSTTEPAALCVAVTGGYAAVGYHGDGLKLFSLESGERTWASEDLRVSILCLMWLAAEEPDLLVSGGGDQWLRVWRRPEEGEADMVLLGRFGVQQGPILALAQNSSYLASASDDCSIALWAVKDLTSDPWVDPSVISVLRGHSGGVTCLAFSPTGEELLSGGKDQVLMVWNASSSPPTLTQSLPHCHGDWITGCVWGPNCVLSCSSDCKIRVWDLQKGRSVREILARSSLSAVCCLGEFVIAGCAEGELHVWKWDSGMEISRISAHKSRIHHCSVLPDPDKTKETKQEDMVVATASDDGTVKLWHPFQVQHHSTLQGHSGGIHGAVSKQEGVPAFLTVSEDRSLRSWSVAAAMESPLNQRGTVTALSFSQSGDVLLSGYESGRVEIWKHNSAVGHKKVSDSSVTAICSMPDGQFAVGCRQRSVSVWKLEWNPQHNAASLLKVSTYSVPTPVMHLYYCSILLGTCEDGNIINVLADADREINNWKDDTQILGMVANDEKSTWLVGEKKGQVVLGFLYAMGPKTDLQSSCGEIKLEMEETCGGKGGWITAVTVERELVVCGDSKGNMWFNQPPNVNSWSSRKPAHSDRISVLRLTNSTMISASHDRTVKMWDRNTKKQVGVFVCSGPVLVLEVNPHCSSELVCGDALGQLYFLSWRE